MRVFLDVGAHEGETLRGIRDRRYSFDRIYCFEPVQACVRKLDRFRDPRLTVCPFGLGKENGRATIYDPGSFGASVYWDKNRSNRFEDVQLVSASEWFQENVRIEDDVYLKLNCEGSEADIVRDLIDSDEIRKVTSILLHLDLRRIPSQRHRETEVLSQLERQSVRYTLAEQIQRGPSEVSLVQNWLKRIGLDDFEALPWSKRVHSQLLNLRYVVLPSFAQRLSVGRFAGLLPRSVYSRLLPVWRKICRGF